MTTIIAKRTKAESAQESRSTLVARKAEIQDGLAERLEPLRMAEKRAREKEGVALAAYDDARRLHAEAHTAALAATAEAERELFAIESALYSTAPAVLGEFVAECPRLIDESRMNWRKYGVAAGAHRIAAINAARTAASDLQLADITDDQAQARMRELRDSIEDASKNTEQEEETADD